MSDQTENIILENSSNVKELTDVTLVIDDDKKIPAHCLVLATSSTIFKTKEDTAKENKNESVKNDDDIRTIQVKYSLNKIKNLEVVKANASRPVKVDRITTNDTNIRYEMNAGLYLHIKEDMLKFKKDQVKT